MGEGRGRSVSATCARGRRTGSHRCQGPPGHSPLGHGSEGGEEGV